MINVVSMSWEEEKKLEDDLYVKFIDLRLGGIPVSEVYANLGLDYGSAMAKRIRRRFKQDGYSCKSVHVDRDVGLKYIYRTHHAKEFCIIKRIDDCNRYFGSYASLDVAKFVRDELEKCGWDKNCLEDILSNLD